MVQNTIFHGIASCRLCRKRKAGGKALEQTSEKSGKETKSGAVFAILFTMVVLILCGIFMLAGNFEAEFREASLYIDATFWHDFEISYADIDHIELRETDDIGDRTMGYGDIRVCMGTFKNEEFGTYTRYSHTDCHDALVLYMQNTVVVLNGKDERETAALYEKLSEKVK